MSVLGLRRGRWVSWQQDPEWERSWVSVSLELRTEQLLLAIGLIYRTSAGMMGFGFPALSFIRALAGFLITCPVFSKRAFFFFSLWHHLKLEPWFLPHGRMIQTTTAAFLNYLNSFIRDHLPSGYLKEPEEIFKIWNVENVLGKPTFVYFLGSLRQKYQCEPSRIMLSFPRVWPLLKSKR